jgi:hypothetical protein
MLAEVPLDRVEIPDGRRAVDPAAVARLKNSIAVVGLQHPITVAKRGGSYRLLAGAHRLRAFRELGMERISANIVELDDLHAELVELDENLARNEFVACGAVVGRCPSQGHPWKRYTLRPNTGLLEKGGSYRRALRRPTVSRRLPPQRPVI